MSVIWTPVEDSLPDADQTVLIACASGSEPVWLGYHDGADWRSVDAELVDVTHWAEMPEGPVEAVKNEKRAKL